MHLWFTQLAEALGEAGYDVKKTLRDDIEIPWTSHMVKELLWRPVQEAMFGKRSTTELSSAEIDKVYDVINREIGNRTGVTVAFPNIEELMNNSLPLDNNNKKSKI